MIGRTILKSDSTALPRNFSLSSSGRVGKAIQNEMRGMINDNYIFPDSASVGESEHLESAGWIRFCNSSARVGHVTAVSAMYERTMSRSKLLILGLYNMIATLHKHETEDQS